MVSVPVLTAPIVAVEVLRSSALIRRRGTLPQLGAEDGTAVELTGLPLGLLDGSVRVQIQPAQACRVLEVHVGLHLPAPVEELSGDQDLKRLRREQAHLEHQRARMAHRVEELLRIRPTMPPIPREHGEARFVADDPGPAWLELGEFLQQAGAEHQRRVREIDARLRELSEELKQAEERAATSRSEPTLGRPSKRVRIQLDRVPERSPEVELSYQVPGSRWFPTYELHLARGGRQATLIMHALLAQLTGEDWTDVELHLSTADLQRTCSLPALPAWRIGRARSADVPLAWRPLPADLEELFRDFDRQRPPPLPTLSPPVIDLPGREPLAAHPASAPTTVMDRRDLEGRIPTEEGYGAVEEPEWTEARGELEAAAGDEEATREVVAEEHVFVSAELPVEVLRDRPAPERSAAPSTPAPPPAGPAGSVKGSRAAVPGPSEPRLVQAAPAEALLAYGQLVLGAPEERGRGQLRPPRAEESAGLEDGAEPAVGLADFQRFRELADLECLDLPVGAISVEESAGPFAHRYSAPPGAPIPTDGQVHRISVLQAEIPVTLIHRTLPLLDASVYRLARLQNPLDRPLLAGPMDVFWNGDYLITTQLKTTAAGGPIESALGLEPCIRVARNVKHTQREGGLLGGRTVFDEEIVIDVESHLDGDTVLEVIERLPISDDRKVEIKVNEETPQAEGFDQKERGHPIHGGRRWRLTLTPRHPERLLLRYQIAVPGKSEIVGGGRRAS